MSETLQMIFSNALGRNSTISLADPDPALTGEAVGAVMSSIISRDVFAPTGGALVGKVRAQVVTRTVDVLDEF